MKELSAYLEAYLRKRLGAASFIDDIVQEVLLGIHKARHTYDAERPFLPWFHAIIRYKSIDCLRHHSRQAAFEILDSDSIELYSETFWQSAPDMELDNELLQALAALPGKQKQAVELLKLQGLSAKEAGQLMGMSEGAVKVSAHRAYVALRQHFMGGKK
ncbi:MAG: sigma-70 family RNA polymerase sigma factor [Pseudobdellovibrionaceae bacterium]|nr:sigma-70 family RNA polymerase sigma factor [Pseudobdellovibrionaceae bacterium]